MNSYDQAFQAENIPELELPSEWKVYEDSEYDLTLKYPQTWKYRIKDNFLSRDIIFLPTNHQNQGSRVTISIEEVDKNKNLSTLEEYAEELRDSFIKHNDKTKVLLEKNETILLNAKAYEILYKFERDKKTMKKMAIVTLRDNKGYIFYYEAYYSDFSKIESVVREMESSLKFRDF